MSSKVQGNAGAKPLPPNAGKGRKKGVPNKLTASAREAFMRAFDDLGGARGLAAWAKDNPTEFYKLYARLIPQDHNHSGQLTLEAMLQRVHEAASAEAPPEKP